MDIREKIKDRILSLEAAANKVPKGDCVLVSMGVGVPYPLLNTVSEQTEEMLLLTGLLANPVKAFLKPYSDKITVYNWFFGPIERMAMGMKSRLSFQPMHLSDTTFDRTGKHSPDTVLIQVCPRIEDGLLSQGPSPLPTAAIEKACLVIAQINERVPFVRGEGTMVPVEKIDYFTEAAEDLYSMALVEPNETDKQIASHIVDKIDDGSCIQLGIGGVGTAVGSFLKEKKELSIHSEMFVDSMVDLMECGAVTNSRKELLPGKTVFGFASGNKIMYDFLGKRDDVLTRPFEWVNDPRTVAQISNFVSINSAMEIDLTGQVCAESIGLKQYSGTGGQYDFVKGAHWSPGGKSFIAMPSSRTDKKGRRFSKISLTLPPGAAVTTLRSDVHYVVTEYGAVDLQNEPLDIRAKRLISIAHPEFRESLEKEAKAASLII